MQTVALDISSSSFWPFRSLCVSPSLACALIAGSVPAPLIRVDGFLGLGFAAGRSLPRWEPGFVLPNSSRFCHWYLTTQTVFSQKKRWVFIGFKLSNHPGGNCNQSAERISNQRFPFLSQTCRTFGVVPIPAQCLKFLPEGSFQVVFAPVRGWFGKFIVFDRFIWRKTATKRTILNFSCLFFFKNTVHENFFNLCQNFFRFAYICDMNVPWRKVFFHLGVWTAKCLTVLWLFIQLSRVWKSASLYIWQHIHVPHKLGQRDATFVNIKCKNKRACPTAAGAKNTITTQDKITKHSSG